MPKSMTGYGRCLNQYDNMDIMIEVKSVNNRFLDTSVRLPRSVSYAEEKLKKLIGSYISRGKVDIYVDIKRTVSDNSTIEIDEAILDQYYTALSKIIEHCKLNEKITLASLTKYPEIFNKSQSEDDQDEMWSRIEEVAVSAFESYNSMRATEGENLRLDLESKADELEAIVKKIDELSPAAVSAYREKLESKIREYIESDSIDDQRVLTEVAIISDKLATDEERTRLYSHISQFRSIIALDEPIGKKLDFLVQELNREVNTIGSKCQMLEISKLVIEAKCIIEKIREQIQNIE